MAAETRATPLHPTGLGGVCGLGDLPGPAACAGGGQGGAMLN